MPKKRRITYATAVILLAICRGHRYGFAIMDATGLPDGTIYPALRRMEASAMLSAGWEDIEEARGAGRPARRYYELTKGGLAALDEAAKRFPGLHRLIPSEGDSELAPA